MDCFFVFLVGAFELRLAKPVVLVLNRQLVQKSRLKRIVKSVFSGQVRFRVCQRPVCVSLFAFGLPDGVLRALVRGALQKMGLVKIGLRGLLQAEHLLFEFAHFGVEFSVAQL